MTTTGISFLTTAQKTELVRFCQDTKILYEQGLSSLGISLPTNYVREFFVAGSYVNNNAHINSDLDIVLLLPPISEIGILHSEEIKYLKIRLFLYNQKNYSVPTFLNVTAVPPSRIYHPSWKQFGDNNNLLFDLKRGIFIKDLTDFWAKYGELE